MPNKDSIFFHSIKAFSVAAFGVLGFLLGCIIFFFVFLWIAKSLEKETFSSNVKIVADAEGNRKELPATTPVLLQLTIKGEIGKDGATAEKIVNMLAKSREDDFKNNRVKGILLVINSPGGDANDSDIIYRHLLQYKERYKIPIYTFVDGLCASGGFYIACATDKIMASDVSLIGSVGVLSWPPFFNVVDLLQKIGVTTLTLSEGKGKDQMNPTKVWKPDEQKNYQEMLAFFYSHFVDIVVKNRPLITKEKLQEEFGAKMFPAPLAHANGYVDAYGYTLSQAIKELSLAAGLKEGEKYQVVTMESKEWLRRLLTEKPFFLSGKITHEFQIPKEFKWDAPVKYL